MKSTSPYFFIVFVFFLQVSFCFVFFVYFDSPPHPKEKNAPGEDDPLSNRNCTQRYSLSACRQPLPLGQIH